VPSQSFNSDDIDDDAEFCSLDLGGGGGGGRGRRRGGGGQRNRPNFGPGGGEVSLIVFQSSSFGEWDRLGARAVRSEATPSLSCIFIEIFGAHETNLTLSSQVNVKVYLLPHCPGS
jgi:hypothetical protein